jgi:hypothetical protein
VTIICWYSNRIIINGAKYIGPRRRRRRGISKTRRKEKEEWRRKHNHSRQLRRWIHPRKHKRASNKTSVFRSRRTIHAHDRKRSRKRFRSRKHPWQKRLHSPARVHPNLTNRLTQTSHQYLLPSTEHPSQHCQCQICADQLAKQKKQQWFHPCPFRCSQRTTSHDGIPSLLRSWHPYDQLLRPECPPLRSIRWPTIGYDVFLTSRSITQRLW